MIVKREWTYNRADVHPEIKLTLSISEAATVLLVLGKASDRSVATMAAEDTGFMARYLKDHQIKPDLLACGELYDQLFNAVCK